MPVNRAYINGYAISDLTLYQALTAIANQADALESAAGLSIGSSGASGGNAVSAPATPQWTITAANGHFLIQITNPSAASAQVQYRVRFSPDQTFGVSANTTVYTLGVGETTRDIIAPQQTLYFQVSARYQGSNWSTWANYTTTSGVAALNAGTLGGTS